MRCIAVALGLAVLLSQAAVESAGDELPIRSGEIRLAGVILPVSPEQGCFALNVSEFALPGGRSSKLDTSKPKTVVVTDQTQLRRRDGSTAKLALTDLQVGTAVSVVGADQGSGKDLTAREVMVGGSGPSRVAAAPAASRLRGLCVSMNDLQTPTDVESLLTRCRRMGINALFADVYYYGRNVTYASARFPQAQFVNGSPITDARAKLVDQLAMLIDRARPRGIQVHAWYDVGDGRPDMEGAALQKHPDWQVQDWRGERFPWMDLGQPEVRAYTRDLMTDVVRTHRVDGIAFDCIRYVRSHWCCCDYCRGEFVKREGHDPLALIPLPVTGEVNSNPAISPTTATVIAQFEDGTPAIATNVLGAGKVLVLNYEPFGVGAPPADAVARSALRVFGMAPKKPIYVIETPESEQLGPDGAKPGRTWMSRLEVATEPMAPEQLSRLPAGSCALIHTLYGCSEEHATQIETFVRSGGGLIWDLPTAAVLESLRLQRVLGFAEVARWSNRERTIQATEAKSWLPGTEIPAGRRTELLTAWQRWRMQNITSLVAEVYGEAKRINPKVKVSAFVFPDRAAADDVLQDWTAWVKQGIVDFALSMSYWGEKQLAGDLAEWKTIDPSLQRIIPTLAFFDKTVGERTALAPEAVLRQAEMCRVAGTGGHCWFAVDGLTPEIEEALQAKP